ncbi:MAG: monomethylamine:corrinoid methyltransferase [Bacteroidetes bacterium]|nr:monomethylamine:corrinoid methyltransferase [Bacteroidota bacterium]
MNERQRMFLDVLAAGSEGKSIKKADWDFEYVVMKTMEMVQKHELSWSPDTIVPTDDAMIDRLYQAGKELLRETGIYLISENRQILFSEADIDRALTLQKPDLEMGTGNDACIVRPRGVEDRSTPKVWGGNPGAPTPENLFLPIVKSWMKEPIVDLATCGSLIDVDGYPVRTRGVTELLAVRRELKLLHQGLNEAGRPGMGMLAGESSVSEVGDLASAAAGGIRSCDSHLVALFNELMIDNDNLLRAANSIQHGMKNASLAAVMVGGLGGDAPGAAVLEVASFLAANIIALADYHLCHPIHINYVATSAPGCMWLQSAVCQAFARNAPSVIFCDIYPKSGALTLELLLETAANAIAITVSGGHLEGVGSADGGLPNGTGLEVRLMGEVGHAVALQGISRKEANTMITKLIKRYEHVFTMPGGNPGKRFDEAYNLETIEPLPEWQALYEEAKRILKSLGLDLERVC